MREKNPTSLEERLESVRYPIAAQRIEGLVVSAEVIEGLNRVARGEITIEDIRSQLVKRYKCQ